MDTFNDGNVHSKTSQFVQPLFSPAFDSEDPLSNDLDLDIDFKFLSEYLLTEEGALAGAGYRIDESHRTRTKTRKNAPTTTSPPQKRKKSSSPRKAVSDISEIIDTSTKGNKDHTENMMRDDEDAGDTDDDDDDYNFGDYDEDGDIYDGDQIDAMPADSRDKLQQRVVRRRERNRVLARKTRLRKKFFFESLQRQVAQLAKENKVLKEIAERNLDSETYRSVLSDCAELPSCIVSSANANSILEKADLRLVSAIQRSQKSFCISDPNLVDNPIVFASDGFLQLTGYTLDQVIGRNCRMLQGERTDREQIEILKKGIAEGTDTSIIVYNYKADGTEFLNHIFVAALRDEDQNIVNFVGVQKEVSPEETTGNLSVSGTRKKGRPVK